MPQSSPIPAALQQLIAKDLDLQKQIQQMDNVDGIVDVIAAAAAKNQITVDRPALTTHLNATVAKARNTAAARQLSDAELEPVAGGWLIGVTIGTLALGAFATAVGIAGFAVAGAIQSRK
jgi:hypothetical protein